MAESIEIDYDWPELAAAVLSKELRDGETGSPGGARSEIPLAAARLAQLTHAPNLSIITSATGFVSNINDKRRAPLCALTTDYRNIHAGAEAVLHFVSIFRTDRDWFFGGGLQVDTYGNLNMTAIGDIRAPTLHGPGAAGLAYTAGAAKRYYIYMQQHTRRSFVKRVDYVTAHGYGRGPGDRETLRLRGGGPTLVISPLALMDFCPHTYRLRLKSLHPGVTLEEVRDNTGADMIVPARVPLTRRPSADELTLLRNEIDREGILRSSGRSPAKRDAKGNAHAATAGH
ncbi:CoA-transferase [Bradyrhizobium sp. LHD-71]|uniref:CoA-transferase subunit beta n=1 Tax=Bradyrhizobium sp. LHD-71 TaxID=3072141 RepID=UPI0028100A63|nr:CoA-transferase [Bradyrhizobium sp. LHD-71]MDQ8727419.1 CoA-transferase [Bradyrhizobium sp. LHD-71]